MSSKLCEFILATTWWRLASAVDRVASFQAIRQFSLELTSIVILKMIHYYNHLFNNLTGKSSKEGDRFFWLNLLVMIGQQVVGGDKSISLVSWICLSDLWKVYGSCLCKWCMWWFTKAASQVFILSPERGKLNDFAADIHR